MSEEALKEKEAASKLCEVIHTLLEQGLFMGVNSEALSNCKAFIKTVQKQIQGEL